MNDIQRKMLELLAEFDDICRRSGVEYCVCSGCALGIERHGGYIPWDDDIDLFITRDNFNKLCGIMKTSLPPDRAWVTEENYPEYENPLARYVDLSTTQVLRSRIGDGTPMGLYLELFILDPYPSDPEKQKEYNKYMWLFCELKTTRFIAAGLNYYREVLDKEKYHYYQDRIVKEGKQAVLDEIERDYLTYNYDECELLCVRWGFTHVVLRKEWMENLVYREFEGYMLPFIKDNLDYLCYTEYGFDWDIIPSSGNRLVHDTIVSTTEPCSIHEKDIEEISNKRNYVNLMVANKRDRVEKRFLDLDVQEMAARQKKLLLEMLAENAEDSFDLTAEFKNLPLLRKLTHKYLLIQTNRRYYLTGTRADISDRFLNALLYVMIFDDMIKPLKPVLEIYSDRPLTEKYRDATEWICSIKMATYKNEPERVRILLTQLEEAGFGKQIEVERARMWLAVNGPAQMNEEQILSELQKSAEPSDPCINKFVGDFYYGKGEMRKADKWYSKALETRNGMILHDMHMKGFF